MRKFRGIKKEIVVMKKFLLMLLAACGMFFLTGCSDSPEDVVANWMEAIADGDLETANEYSTAKSERMNALMIDMVKKDEKRAGKISETLDKLDDATVEIDGDTATVKFDGGSVPLRKVDGDWKVDYSK